MAFYRGEDGAVKFGSTSAAVTGLGSGDVCVILTAGDTDFTAIGAADNNPGTVFTASGAGSGTGTVAVTAAVAGTRSWSLTLDKAVIEATAMGDTHAANIGSIISGSGSAEVIYQAGTGETNNFVEQVNSGNDNGFVAFELFLDSSSKKILFAGITTSAEVTSTVGELSIVTVNFVTTGPITLTL